MNRQLFPSLIVLTLIIAIGTSSCNSGGDSDSNESVSLKSVELSDVEITDSFWLPMIERNRLVTIPYAFGKCEETGRIDNFAIAAGVREGAYTGMRYNDSDVYKILEGACWSMLKHPDPILERYVDSLIYLIAEAQEDDGYLYTTRTIDPANPAPGAGAERWEDVWVSHELYGMGHMIEAAVAHYKATGKRTLLDVAIKSADLICTEFGWGRKETAPGHQEIEIALVKLAGITGNEKYLETAAFFLDVRGLPQDHLIHPPGTRFDIYNDLRYLQQHKRVVEQDSAVGHAVRGAYMYTAMADVAASTGRKELLEASRRLWSDVTTGKIYITGGIGSLDHGESFGAHYQLPNMTAYTETCASVANVFWNERLFLASGESKYIDVLERTLYNGLISGIGHDGMNFFYPNPLESDASFERSGWFDCSCCPGNIARFMPSMARYIYSSGNNAVYINLFIGSEASVATNAGTVNLKMETEYPWSGKVRIQINDAPDEKVAIKIRIPAWSSDEPIPGGLYSYLSKTAEKPLFYINGKRAEYETVNGYASFHGRWHKGDIIEMEIPMEVRKVVTNEEVESNRGRIAFERGPLVYCLEETDNGKVRNLMVSTSTEVSYEYQDSLLGGLGTLTFNVTDTEGAKKMVTAVPYFSWANRGRGEMIVWMKNENR